MKRRRLHLAGLFSDAERKRLTAGKMPISRLRLFPGFPQSPKN
jgi:hypothetical protein